MGKTPVPILVLATVMILFAGGAAAANGRVNAQTTSRAVVVSTRAVPKLGTVLVDGRGRTLYMFVPDKRLRVTCTHICAAVWPPLGVPKGAEPVAKGKVKKSLLGSDPNPAGGRVVTYNHWPLYTYVADRAPGQAKGQALNLNGGLWYVIAPSGKVIYRKP